MKRLILVSVVVWGALLIYGGCPGPAAAAARSAAPAQSSVSTPASAQKEWDRTVAAGKKEGELLIYTAGGTAIKEALKNAFEQKYGIKIGFLPGAGRELTARIFNERRAGLYLTDLFLSGPNTPTLELKPAGVLAPIKPLLILPEVLNTKAYFDGEIPFVDNEGVYTIFHGTRISFPMVVNSELVKPGEIKAYADLLDPKWHGKIVMGDPTISGATGKMFAVTVDHITGADFHRQLVKQNPLILRDLRQQVEWVARGKYSVSLGPYPDVVADLLAAGAPLKIVLPREGIYIASGASGTLSYFDRAPHPNAAKVFVNWFMSKEGLTVWSKANLQQTARQDLPTDFLIPELVRNAKVKYLNPDNEEDLKKLPARYKLAAEIYAPLLK